MKACPYYVNPSLLQLLFCISCMPSPSLLKIYSPDNKPPFLRTWFQIFHFFSNRFLIGNDFSNLHNTCTARRTHLYQQQLYANYKLTRDNLCPVLCFAFDMSDMFVDIVVNLIPRVYPAFQHQQFITTNI